jgi:hypothetical protein
MSIQSTFTTKKIEEKLKGYKSLDKKDFKHIQPGDKIRYSMNNEFRGGGVIKLIKWPDYLICLNVINKVSWSVQLKNPTLCIWCKPKDEVDKERMEKERIFELYKQGKLQKVKR